MGKLSQVYDEELSVLQWETIQGTGTGITLTRARFCCELLCSEIAPVLVTKMNH